MSGLASGILIVSVVAVATVVGVVALLYEIFER